MASVKRNIKAVNNRLSGEGIFCDPEKVFDCVNHGNIVDKLWFSGISWKFLTLIQSYLRRRYQRLFIVSINSYYFVSSRWKIYKSRSSGFELGFIIYCYLY